MEYKKIIDELFQEFQRIQNLGWVVSRRSGDTGIGKTFEDLLNKKEDNLPTPDYKGIEIKAQRNATSSMITLFTKSPNYPRGINSVLREQFGNTDAKYENRKILHSTVSGFKFNTHVGGYAFKVKVDRELNRLVLQVKDQMDDTIVFEKCYWSFDILKNTLTSKLNCIAYISADEKKEGGKTLFKFTNMKIITGLSFENFLLAIENGDILIDIRIGVYNSGTNKGRTHDHDTGFRITLAKLIKYANIKEM